MYFSLIAIQSYTKAASHAGHFIARPLRCKCRCRRPSSFATRLAGIRDGVGFHADTVEGLREAFHEAVEDYVEACAKIGKEPQKTYSGQVMFRVSPDVHRKAALAAELSGKSLNQWAEEVLDRAAG